MDLMVARTLIQAGADVHAKDWDWEFLYVTGELGVPRIPRTDDIVVCGSNIDIPLYTTSTRPRIELVLVGVIHMKATRLRLDDIRRRSVNLLQTL